MNIEIHSCCEIEDFAETHLCKLWVVLLSRRLLGVGPHQGYRSASPPWICSVACIRVNTVMLGSLCAETIKPGIEEDKIWLLWEEMNHWNHILSVCCKSHNQWEEDGVFEAVGRVKEGGGEWIAATALLVVRNMTRWYQLRGSVYYSGLLWF